MRASALFLSLSLFLVPPAGAEGEDLLTEIDGLDAGDLEVRGFRIDHDQSVRIRATDLEARQHFGELTAAWILEARTRRVVWKMGDSKAVRAYRGFRDYDDTARLRAGVYEVYYATYPDEYEINEDEGWWRNAGRAIRRFAEREILGHEEYDEATESLRLAIHASGDALDDDELEQAHTDLRRQAVVSLAPVGDDDSKESGFVLERPMELVVYAVGELTRSDRFDHGWIVDARTRRKVWSFDYEASERAGGSSKNRIVRQRLRLPAGRYAAFFRTDDSHSADDWNALPPRDPAFWGLTVWARFPKELQHVKSFQYRHLPEDRVIVDLTGLRDDQSVSRGVTLAEPMDVRIFALGEGLKSGMADFGWVVDARTREIVWKMEFERTAPAGGAAKNRVIDEVVRFKAGDYVVIFVTDGSHAFRHWHGKPPPRPERWGIMLLGEADFDVGKVKPYREEEDRAVLARIAQVTDGSHVTQTFTLDHPTRVVVYALGEGSDGTMHDYAWLEHAESGRVIWQMIFERTGHAGGAAKNRMFRGVLGLAPGEYHLHYVSDDSHAFGDWNEPAPHDPEAWGVHIAVAREDGVAREDADP